MDPGPPSPSRRAKLSITPGTALGMRWLPSRTKALNILAGGIDKAISFSQVMTPIIHLDFENEPIKRKNKLKIM
jgi:hypothetical protein